MKTCASCRSFVPIQITDGKSRPEVTDKGECHYMPPRKSSERGGSYRPTVHRDDPACAYHSRQLPPAVPLPKAELIRLEVVASREVSSLLDRLQGCAALIKQPEPAVMPRQGRWNCWHTQAATVRAIMAECGMLSSAPKLHVLHNAQQVMGLSGGIFADISNHPQQAPDEILALAERAGMMRIRMSDEWLRSKAERLMGKSR